LRFWALVISIFTMADEVLGHTDKELAGGVEGFVEATG
jgi:hypothetical protein